MSGVSLDYLPGRIAARFGHADWDDIRLDVHLSLDVTLVTEYDEDGRPVGSPQRRVGAGTDFCVYLSSAYCPFHDFIAFLEAISVGLECCSFSWDAEGPTGTMSWTRAPDGLGNLAISWRAQGESVEHAVLVKRTDAVQSLYGAFRSFVDSSEYDPFRYEALSMREAVELTLRDGTPDQVIPALASLSATEAEDRLQRLGAWMDSPLRGWKLQEWPGAREEREPHELCLIPSEWDRWSAAEKIAHLEDGMTKHVGRGWGANLRKMRSRIIEELR
jgi:hypothetical protein